MWRKTERNRDVKEDGEKEKTSKGASDKLKLHMVADRKEQKALTQSPESVRKQNDKFVVTTISLCGPVTLDV